MASTTKPWYMTSARRKQMDKEFQYMLKANHDALLSHCNRRYPETVEGVLAENPHCKDPAKVADFNRRSNERSRAVEDMIMRLDSRWQD